MKKASKLLAMILALSIALSSFVITTLTTNADAGDVPRGLTATYYQKKGAYSEADGNFYKAVFNSVGAPSFNENNTLPGGNRANNKYFERTINGMLAISKQLGDVKTGLTDFTSSSAFFYREGNDYLVHYEGTITARTTGTYQFVGLEVDNGCAIKVNGTLVYEYWNNGAWFDGGGKRYADDPSFTLQAGVATPIEIWYLELGGGEALTMQINDGSSDKSFADAGISFALQATVYKHWDDNASDWGGMNSLIPGGNGERGQYHSFVDNQHYDDSIAAIEAVVTELGTITVDTFIINNNDEFRTNAAKAGCYGDDGILVKYKGYITADADGEYLFGLNKADNGCVITIGDTRVLEYWGNNTYRDNEDAVNNPLYEQDKAVTMKAGESLPIEVVYLELGGGEALTISVSKDGAGFIKFEGTNLILSTEPVEELVEEEIPVLEETNERELFYTDFTSTNNINIVGSPVVDTEKGTMFMSRTDYIDLGIDILKDVGLKTTIEFVVKPSEIVEHAGFAGIGTNDTVNHNWVVMGMRSDGAVKFGMRTVEAEIGAGDSGRTQGGLLSAGTWAVVKYVFEETKVTVFVNGNAVKSWNTTGQKDLSEIPGDFVFGKELRFGDPGFAGTVSELRVTSTEKVIKLRNKADGTLVKYYTDSELNLADVELDGYLPMHFYNAAGATVETATAGDTVYMDLLKIDYPVNTGRSIRVADDNKNGVRFRATIKRGDFYDYFNDPGDYVYSEDSNFKFGIVLLPANMVPDGEELTLNTSGVLDIVAENIYEQENEDGDLEYTGVLIGIPEKQSNTTILARAYITYVFNGKTYTIYSKDTAFGSYLSVARKVYADDEIDSGIKDQLEELFGEDLEQIDEDLFGENTSTNQWASHSPVKSEKSGIYWPDDQAMPIFATPADVMDTIEVSQLNADEQIAFSALQGLVNKTQPRIYIVENSLDWDWANSATVGFFNRNTYNSNNKYDLIKKYADELDGVVLYSTDRSNHYRNLASTVAGLRNAIPVTQAVYTELQNRGISLPIVENLTSLTQSSEADIYNYLYNNYWSECSRRLIVSLNPNDILTFTRDIGVATGAAVVYLDCKNTTQRNLYEKFLKDMADNRAATGESCIATGWFTEERSGVGAGTKYGIGSVPSDFYISSTAHAGVDHTIQAPAVPQKEAVENKVYIVIYISDGDNIQYNQGYMKMLWDESESVRGKVPLNWTISPALVDIGPGLLNYYYTTATDLDCFVCGPSGIGYAMPIDTSSSITHTTYLSDSSTDYIDSYTKLSGTYFERSGLRVVTAWDNLSTVHRRYYEQNCRYLYGATVHEWNGTLLASVSASTVNDLRFDKHTLCYTSSYKALYNDMSSKIKNASKNSPSFYSYQVSVWGDDGLGSDNMKPAPANILKLYEQLSAEFPGQFEFVRADHYFALYNEANNLNYNLSMDKSTVVTTSDSGDTTSLRDGSFSTVWTSSKRSEQYVQFDLGATHSIHRYVLRLAGNSGMSDEYNVRAFHVEVSTNGDSWTTIDTYKENIQDVVDIDLASATNARYIRFVIDDAAGDGLARIADIEVYGK